MAPPSTLTMAWQFPQNRDCEGSVGEDIRQGEAEEAAAANNSEQFSGNVEEGCS